jgi:hypothetical protein
MLEQAPGGSLPVFRGESWEEHVSAALVVREGLEEHLWAMAAICASVDRRWGQGSMGKFASEVGYSARRVYELAATYLAYQSRERSQSLSFQHHAIAARDPEPEMLLTRAEDEGWSTRDLDVRVKERRRQSGGEKSDEQSERTCPRCGGSGRIGA